MRTARSRLAAAIMAATLLAGCSGATEPGPSPTGDSATASPTATASSSPRPSTSRSPSPTATACAAFGTLDASASSPDWGADVRGAPGDELWGATMRVGTHECYDRWVFEFAGDADMPGWSVTPHDASTFLGDPSGEPISPPLAGTASLDVQFAAWSDGTPIDRDPFAGPEQILTTGLPAIREARLLGAFEAISHVGIGLDRARPYRVTWLSDPGRLVIDVYTGS